MSLFDGLIDEKTLKILSLFSKSPTEFYHINKVSVESKVPLATSFRIINSLLSSSIIEYKQISKFKIYRLADNVKTRKLRRLLI
jgi:hypothetical protein